MSKAPSKVASANRVYTLLIYIPYLRDILSDSVSFFIFLFPAIKQAF